MVNEILYHYGVETQIGKLCEEALELALAITHYRTGKGSIDDVLEEIADCKLLIEQLAESHHSEKIEKWFDFKLLRQLKRIDDSKDELRSAPNVGSESIESNT